MQGYETPYTIRREGRSEHIGWLRLYEIKPLELCECLQKGLEEDRILYQKDPLWWKGSGEDCCPRVILDNIFGVIPCFNEEGALESILLADLVEKTPVKVFPAEGKNPLLVCKALRTFGRKYLQDKGIEWRNEFRKGAKLLDYASLTVERKSAAKEVFLEVIRFGKTDTCYTVSSDGLTPAELEKGLNGVMNHFRLLYFSDPLWWKGDEDWRCPPYILDKRYGVIPCFGDEWVPNRILLVDLISKELIGEFPSGKKRLRVACQKALSMIKGRGFSSSTTLEYHSAPLPKGVLSWTLDNYVLRWDYYNSPIYFLAHMIKEPCPLPPIPYHPSLHEHTIQLIRERLSLQNECFYLAVKNELPKLFIYFTSRKEFNNSELPTSSKADFITRMVPTEIAQELVALSLASIVTGKNRDREWLCKEAQLIRKKYASELLNEK